MTFDIHVPKKERKILSIDGPDPGFGVGGYWRLVLRNRDGSVACDTGWFKNLITNAGMSRITDYDISGSWWNYAAIGSGTGTPAFTDTAMYAQLGSRQIESVGIVSGWGASNAYFYQRRAYRWAEGQGTGTIREVGTFTAPSGGTMFSHALLVDAGGSPTSLVKGADQSLDVYYEIRNYPMTSDVTGTLDLSGTAYNYIFRAFSVGGSSVHNVLAREIPQGGSSGLGAYTGNIVARTATSLDGSVNPSLFYDQPVITALAKGNYYNEHQIQIGIDAWHGTLRTIRFNTGNSCYQCQYDKVVGGGGIVKTDEDRLRLRIRLTAARH